MRCEEARRRGALGAALRDARDRSGKTLAEVAFQIGRVTGSVCDYEAGRREPPGLVLFDLAQVLGVRLDVLARASAPRAA